MYIYIYIKKTQPFFTIFTEFSFARFSPRAMKSGEQIPPKSSIVYYSTVQYSTGWCSWWPECHPRALWLISSLEPPREVLGCFRPLEWPSGARDAIVIVRPGHGPWQKKSSMKEGCVVLPDRQGKHSKGCKHRQGMGGGLKIPYLSTEHLKWKPSAMGQNSAVKMV